MPQKMSPMKVPNAGLYFSSCHSPGSLTFFPMVLIILKKERERFFFLSGHSQIQLAVPAPREGGGKDLS